MSRRTSWALGVLALLSSASALATVVISQSIEEMAAAAPLIVHGRVGGQLTRWDDGHRTISTYTEVVTSEALKGKAPDVLLVRQPGGEVGRVGQHASGAARFKEGEEVVLFLEPARDEPTVFVVYALSAGKVSFESSALKELRAVRNLEGLVFYEQAKDGPPRLKAVGRDDLGTRDGFLNRVRAAAGKKVAQ
ncbi:MAG: hypothetical protein ACYC8T_22145 [Myxococcaceae bacterium]